MRLLVWTAGLLLAASACGGGPAHLDPSTAGPDFLIQGEYVGELDGDQYGAQVIAWGDGRFEAVLCRGGLPGEGCSAGPMHRFRSAEAKRTRSGEIVFVGPHWSGTLADGVLTAAEADGNEVSMMRVERESPTARAAAPGGALVLFDGTGLDRWEDARLSGDRLLEQGAVGRDVFGDHRLHLEFRIPYMPNARGQARGNSGVYLQGRYEIQVLDSFGLESQDNDCAAAYGVAPPHLNMSYPPLSWQTYDVDFVAARFDERGRKIANARLTVLHNGVPVHEDLEIPENSNGALGPEAEAPGPLYLQDHGDPVRFRNIWALPSN